MKKLFSKYPWLPFALGAVVLLFCAAAIFFATRALLPSVSKPMPTPISIAQLQKSACGERDWDEALRRCVPAGFAGKVRPAKAEGEAVTNGDVFIVESASAGGEYLYLAAETRSGYGNEPCLFWFWNRDGELGGCFPTNGWTETTDGLGRVFKNTRNIHNYPFAIPEQGRKIWVVKPVVAHARVRTAQLIRPVP